MAEGGRRRGFSGPDLARKPGPGCRCRRRPRRLSMAHQNPILGNRDAREDLARRAHIPRRTGGSDGKSVLDGIHRPRMPAPFSIHGCTAFRKRDGLRGGPRLMADGQAHQQVPRLRCHPGTAQAAGPLEWITSETRSSSNAPVRPPTIGCRCSLRLGCSCGRRSAALSTGTGSAQRHTGCSSGSQCHW